MKNITVPFQKLHRITELGQQTVLRQEKPGKTGERFQDVMEGRNASRFADESWQEYFEALNEERDGVIRAVRCLLNDWAVRLGVGLVSISLEPVDCNENPLDFAKILAEHKAPTDGLISAIEYGKPRIIAAFDVSHAGEEMMNIGVNSLLAADSTYPDYLTVPQPVEKIIIRQRATLQLELLDKKVLQQSGVSFMEIQGDDADAAQRYLCRFLK